MQEKKLENDNFSDQLDSFQDRLGWLMKRAGCSQSDLARSMGTRQSTVQGWLNGAVPRRRTLLDLATFFNVSVVWLEVGKGCRDQIPRNVFDEAAERVKHEPNVFDRALRTVIPPATAPDEAVERRLSFSLIQEIREEVYESIIDGRPPSMRLVALINEIEKVLLAVSLERNKSSTDRADPG